MDPAAKIIRGQTLPRGRLLRNNFRCMSRHVRRCDSEGFLEGKKGKRINHQEREREEKTRLLSPRQHLSSDPAFAAEAASAEQAARRAKREATKKGERPEKRKIMFSEIRLAERPYYSVAASSSPSCLTPSLFELWRTSRVLVVNVVAASLSFALVVLAGLAILAGNCLNRPLRLNNAAYARKSGQHSGKKG